MSPRIFELLGVRGFYRFMSRLAGEPMLPPSTSHDLAAFDQDKLNDIREGARYFLIANVFRLAVYIPPGHIAIRESAWIPLGTMAFLAAFHLSCIILETYKTRLCRHHESRMVSLDLPLADLPADPDIRLSSRMHWYFAPKSWETEKFYRWIGMEPFKNLVTWYIDQTRLTKGERESGRKTTYVRATSYADALQFVEDTRVNETIHVCALIINLPVFIEAIALDIPAIAWFILPVVVGDTYLVLLQRFHRLRMWPLLEKARSRN